MAESKRARPAWVTGAGGFIGLHLARSLLRDGHDVVGFGRRDSSDFAALAGGVYISGGVVAATLEAAFAEYGRPSAVFHLAGGATVGQSIADPLRDFEQSVVSAANMLDFLRRRAPETPVVLASSAAVYGSGHSGPIRVDAPLTPYSPYGHHKHMVEELGQSYHAAYGQPVSVARLFSVYGEGLRKQLLWDLCQKLAAGQADIVLDGTGVEMRDWHHVSDVVRAIRCMLPAARMPFAIYNGGAGAPASVSTIAELVLKSWGGSRSLSFSGRSRQGDPVRLIADPSGMPQGFQLQVELSRGIDAYVNWYRALSRDESVRDMRSSTL